MGTELAEGGVVHLAVERDVVLDLGAAVDAVQDVALQVLVDSVVLLQAVQRDAVERQRAGDLLSGQKSFSGIPYRAGESEGLTDSRFNDVTPVCVLPAVWS